MYNSEAQVAGSRRRTEVVQKPEDGIVGRGEHCDGQVGAWELVSESSQRQRAGQEEEVWLGRQNPCSTRFLSENSHHEDPLLEMLDSCLFPLAISPVHLRM